MVGVNTEYQSYRFPPSLPPSLSLGFLSDFGRDRLISLPRVRLKSEAAERARARRPHRRMDGLGIWNEEDHARGDSFLPSLLHSWPRGGVNSSRRCKFPFALAPTTLARPDDEGANEGEGTF